MGLFLLLVLAFAAEGLERGEAAGTSALPPFFVSVLEAVVWPQPRTFFSGFALGTR